MARRGKDVEWNIYEGGSTTWEKVPIALLMDIRDQLMLMNRYLRVLECPNFTDIPRKLDLIRRHTNRIPAKRKESL